jgi:hypothetical protein
MSSISRGPTAIILTVVFTSLAAGLVLARLFARFIILRNPGPDELVITISLVSRYQIFILDILYSSYV